MVIALRSKLNPKTKGYLVMLINRIIAIGFLICFFNKIQANYLDNFALSVRCYQVLKPYYRTKYEYFTGQLTDSELLDRVLQYKDLAAAKCITNSEDPVNFKAQDGTTPLYRAVDSTGFNATEILLALGAKKDSEILQLAKIQADAKCFFADKERLITRSSGPLNYACRATKDILKELKKD